MAPLNIITSNLLANVLLPVHKTLCSAGLEVLVPNGGIIPPGDTSMIPLNWKFNLLHCDFGLLKLLNQQAKKEVDGLDEMICLVHQGQMDCCSTMKVRKIMSGIQATLFDVS